MKKLKVFGLVVIVSTTMWSQAEARPESGFGLFGGFASHSADGTFTIPPFTGINFSYSSSGLSIGIDYQIAMGENISFSPFLVSSSEGTSGDLASGVDAGHGILGIQLRYWMEDLFLGGHFGNYSEVLSGGPGGDNSASGFGFGFIVGLEQESGLFFSGQYDTFTVNYSDADVDLTGIRLHIGYRWK